MSVRKYIAVIMSRPDYDYQTALLEGIFRTAFKNDCNVAVFSTPNSEMFAENIKYPGRIFDLPNTEHLCGIIYVPDTINDADAKVVTEKLRRTTDCKVISIDYEIDGFNSISNKGEQAAEIVISHMIEVHGCKKIAFMTGPQDNVHSEGRLHIFRRIMQSHGLEVDESLLFYGDFWYNEGKTVVNSLTENGKALPDAIVCASERMAYSVYKALTDKGYKVPRDVLLGCYSDGNSDFGFITYCGKDVQALGDEAVDWIFNGPDEHKAIRIDKSLEVQKSFTCGCAPCPPDYIFEPKNDTFSEEVGYFSINNGMMGTLLNSVDFTDYFWKIDWYTRFVEGLRHFSICMSNGWDTLLPEHMSLYDKSTPMHLLYQRDVDDNGNMEHSVLFDRKFDISEMHPVLWRDTEKPQAFFFYPLVSDDNSFGYAALSFGHTTRSTDNIYLFWLKDIVYSFESQKRRFAMEYLYQQMQKNAITDVMTSLGNHNGYSLKSHKLLSEAKSNGDMIFVIMGDLNCLKYINDTFGHESGNNAIIAAADALSATTVPGARIEENFRMGGDEFLKVAIGKFGNDDAENCIADIKDRLNKVNNSKKYPFPIYLSLGSCTCISSKVKSIDEMMNDADMKMFADKAKIKKETKFDYKRKMYS